VLDKIATGGKRCNFVQLNLERSTALIMQALYLFQVQRLDIVRFSIVKNEVDQLLAVLFVIREHELSAEQQCVHCT